MTAGTTYLLVQVGRRKADPGRQAVVGPFPDEAAAADWAKSPHRFPLGVPVEMWFASDRLAVAPDEWTAQ